MESRMNVLVHHLGIVSTDLPRTIDFYVRLLGGSVAAMGGHTVVTAGDVRIAVVPRRDTDPQGYARGHHVAFQLPVEGRHALLAELDELGAPHEDAGGRIYTRDPDGLTLEFMFE
jgi:catechol 2,3-dioxygenase-like lactoylglutathione lyase family enzyme